MLKRILPIFILLTMLLGCVGLQATSIPAYNLTHAAQDGTTNANATLGTIPPYDLTSTVLMITATARANSFPTLNAEQGQAIRQTQANLLQTESAVITAQTIYSTAYSNNLTAQVRAIAAGTNPALLTETASLASATARSAANQTSADSFAFTATSIIATATARAGIATATARAGIATAYAAANQTPLVFNSPTPCPEYAWTQVDLRYDANGEGDWQTEALIFEYIVGRCMSYAETLFSHEIKINFAGRFDAEILFTILEDAINRLPEYPPTQPEISEMIRIEQLDKGYYTLGIFSYSEALAAYESGLRGADLAEALGIYFP